MKKKLVIMYVTLILGILVSPVKSDLTVQEPLPGEFVVVDDDTGLMWVRDANLAQTSGYDSDGLMTWHEAMAWVDGLSYAGYDDWRLPVNLPVNGVAYDYNYSPDGTTDYGDNITSRSSEMSYLFHVTLENLSRTAPDGSSTQPGWPGGVLSNGPGPFINIMAHYPSGTSSWSGTEYGLDLSYSWLFSFNSGRQSYDLKEVSHYEAWAVRDGDVVPHTHCVSTSAELQDALNVAATNSTPDIIRIRSSVNPYVGNFVYTSTEPYGLTMEGGYTDESCTVRVVDPAANTVLDGGGSGRVLTLGFSGVAVDLVVDGLTLQNGEANGSNGGGLNLNTAGVVTLSNSIIKNNSKNITGFNGGGVYIEGAGLAIIEYSIFDNNGFQNEHIYDGGGIYVSDVNEIRLKNNLFKNNGANGGAGVYLDNATIATVENNTFDKNNGASSGAMRILRSDLVSFSENLVVNNTSYSCAGLSIQHSTDVYLIQNIFNRNRATNGSGGGFVADSNENINIYNNFFTNNTASYFGGGFMSEKSVVATVTNNTFSDNTSGVGGGGVWIQYNVDSAVATLYNNIIYGNSSVPGSDIYIDNDDDNNGNPGTTNLYNNNFDQSNSGIYMKIDFAIDTSNLDNIDPSFVNPTIDDYHLSSSSNLIDAGDNGAVQGLPKDIDGDPRKVDGDNDGNADVDIGADEYVVYDSDGDGIPDNQDACPFSDPSATVIIDGWDTGVENVLLEDGCTISDLISQCADEAANHDEFVSSVSHTTNYLKKEEIISGKEKGMIQKGAAKADIP